MAAEANAQPGVLNLRLYSGDDFSRDMQLVDSNDDGIDIEDWTWLAQVREAPGGDTVLATFTVTVTDAANGRFTLSLTDTAIDDLETGKRLHWDLQATDDGAVRTYVRGSVIVDGDVSRST